MASQLGFLIKIIDFLKKGEAGWLCGSSSADLEHFLKEFLRKSLILIRKVRLTGMALARQG